jgi:hypothetical protein
VRLPVAVISPFVASARHRGEPVGSQALRAYPGGLEDFSVPDAASRASTVLTSSVPLSPLLRSPTDAVRFWGRAQHLLSAAATSEPIELPPTGAPPYRSLCPRGCLRSPNRLLERASRDYVRPFSLPHLNLWTRRRGWCSKRRSTRPTSSTLRRHKEPLMELLEERFPRLSHLCGSMPATQRYKGKGRDWAEKVLGLRVEVVAAPSRWGCGSPKAKSRRRGRASRSCPGDG